MAYVYMVRCQNGSLYTGWTNDLERRLNAHKSGTGAAYTKGFGVQDLAYAEFLPDKSAALSREAALKKLTKAEKEALAAAFDPESFVLLRPAGVQDGADVAKISAYYTNNTTASFLYRAPTEQDCRAEIRRVSKKMPYIVARSAAGTLLGYACAHPWRYGGDAYSWDTETTIYVAPDTRRTGVGRMLYHALLAQLAAQGFWNAYAVLADPNPDSEAFHEAFGFTLEARQARAGWKNGWQGISYWLMQLHEGDGDPGPVPAPLPKERQGRILEAARSGKSWQQILADEEK